MIKKICKKIKRLLLNDDHGYKVDKELDVRIRNKQLEFFDKESGEVVARYSLLKGSHRKKDEKEGE